MTIINMQDARQRDYLALATTKARLKIEIATGLKHSGGSTLTIVNRMFGTTFKRKQAALDWVVQRMAEMRAANDAAQEVRS